MMIQIRETIMKYFKYRLIRSLFFILLLNLISACSIPVNDVSISGRGRPNFKPVLVNAHFNADLVGTSDVVPVSTTLKLPDHSLSANTMRTSSTSTSLRMTSGIGLQ